MARDRLPGEFELIAKYFAPLAKDVPGALGLNDDACVLSPNLGEDLVVTADAMVADIHFLATDPAERVGRKLLRVNLSDLAGKGARPIGYLMTLGLNETIDEEWVAGFARGLRLDQELFGCQLLGGDTVFSPGPLSLSLTAIGGVDSGTAIRRNGGRPGDRILVTGTIGDGYLGLRALRGDFVDLRQDFRRHLIDRYQLPAPRVEFGTALGKSRAAHAGMDISDGLLGDLAHLCAASGCAAQVVATRVPLSEPAAEIVAEWPDLIADLLTGGDDYELLLVAPPERVGEILALAIAANTPLTEVGELRPGQGVSVLDRDRRNLDVPITGFTHF